MTTSTSAEHTTNADGKAEHVEWLALFTVVLFATVTSVMAVIQQDSNHGQAERLDAIEFRLDCPPEHRYVDVNGESFCLEVTP